MKMFNQVIAEFKSGHLDKKLSELLQEAVVKSRAMGGAKAEIVLKLTIKAADDFEMDVTANYEGKMPKHSKFAATLFANEEGDLMVNDPRQRSLLDRIEVVDNSKEKTVKSVS